jgi:hypothetical protein
VISTSGRAIIVVGNETTVVESRHVDGGVKIEVKGPRLADANAEDRAAADMMESYGDVGGRKVAMGKVCLQDDSALRERMRDGVGIPRPAMLPPFPKMKKRSPPPS